MPALSPLPKCVLSAVVTVSVNRLIRNGIAEWRFLWSVSRVELFEFSVALIAPLVMGLEIGIFVAIAASVFVNFILRNSSVLVAIHRLLPVDGAYVDERIVQRMDHQRAVVIDDGRVNDGRSVHPEEVERDGLSTGGDVVQREHGHNEEEQKMEGNGIESVHIMELNAQLSYINVRTLMDELRELITSPKHKDIRCIVVSLALTAFVDTTTMRELTALFQDLKGNEKYLGFSNCKLSVFRSIKKFETRTKCCFGENNVKLFLSTADAASYFRNCI